MKNALIFSCFILFLFASCSNNNYDQNQILKANFESANDISDADESAVKAAAMDYIECFYEADTTKAYRSVSPLLQKRGYGYSKKKQQYSKQYEMSFEQLISLAKTWNADGSQVNDKSPKKVEIFEILDKTASVKVYAQWGIDYLHLSKLDGKWYVMNVLWQSYPPKE
jgi:Putative lumazine-binding